MHNLALIVHNPWERVKSSSDFDIERVYSEQSAFLIIYAALATPDWVVRCVEGQLLIAQNRLGAEGLFSDEYWSHLLGCARQEGFAASQHITQQFRALTTINIANERATPFSVVQSVVIYPSKVLSDAGVPPVHRSLVSTSDALSDDPYGLSPVTLAALHPLLPDVARKWESARTAVLNGRRRSNS